MSGWVIADIRISPPGSKSSASSRSSNPERTEKQTSRSPEASRSMSPVSRFASRAHTHAAPAIARWRGFKSRRLRGYTLVLQLELVADVALIADQVADLARRCVGAGVGD